MYPAMVGCGSTAIKSFPMLPKIFGIWPPTANTIIVETMTIPDHMKLAPENTD